jgi:hypothetical protein
MRWHPILAADEPEPGQWHLRDAYDREYGRVVIVRLDGEVRYRAEFRDELLGYTTTLRRACENVHAAFVRSHGPAPFEGYPTFDSYRT